MNDYDEGGSSLSEYIFSHSDIQTYIKDFYVFFSSAYGFQLRESSERYALLLVIAKHLKLPAIGKLNTITFLRDICNKTMNLFKIMVFENVKRKTELIPGWWRLRTIRTGNREARESLSVYLYFSICTLILHLHGRAHGVSCLT